MTEAPVMENPAYPGTLKDFFDKGGDLGSDEGLQILDKYSSGAIAKVAKNSRAEKQLRRAYANIRGDSGLKTKIFAALTGQF
jgi:hypothetical protein